MSIVTLSQTHGRVPVTILHLHDRVNLGNVGPFEQTAREAIASGARDVVLDLSEVPSITSVGLRAILTIHKLLGRDAPPTGEPATPTEPPGRPWKSTHLKLLNPSVHVRQVLAIAGFDQYLDIYDTLSEALASF